MCVNYKAKIAGNKKVNKKIFGRLSVTPKCSFVSLGSLLSNKPPRLQSVQLLVDRAAWFNSIYLNSTCSWVNTRRCGNANKEAQGSKDRIE